MVASTIVLIRGLRLMRDNVLRIYQKLVATVFLSIAICVGSVGMSAAAESQASPRDLCNRLAEHPFDKSKETEGVYWDEINSGQQNPPWRNSLSIWRYF